MSDCCGIVTHYGMWSYNDINITKASNVIITSPPIGGGRGIVMPMSVCLCVCVFVCLCVCLSVFSQNFKV